MIRIFKYFILMPAFTMLVISFFTLSNSNQTFGYVKDKTYKLRVMFFNDSHGRFWENRHGEGGYSAMSSLVNRLRIEGLKTGYYNLFLVAGDINTGIPESDLLDAEPDFAALNHMKVDALSLGNHEFDKPIDVLKKQLSWAKFPMISANIYYKDTNKPVYKQYTVRSIDGLRIAIFGLTTEDTPLLTSPDNHLNTRFVPAIEEAKSLVPELKDKNYDLVIALTHIGFYPDGNYGTSAPGDFNIAEEVDSIDLIVGGHSHTKLEYPEYIGDTKIVQAGSYTRYLGKIDLEVTNGVTDVVSHKLYPINLKVKVPVAGTDKTERVLVERKIENDPKLYSILEEYQNQGAEKLNVKVGSTDGVFVGEREIVRSNETNLGNLIAEVMAKTVNADIGIMNSGGIRDNLPKGEISYRDILVVQPFGNTITTAVLSGKELREYLQVAASRSPGSGGFPQFYGVNLVLNGDKLTQIKVAGQNIDDNKTYKIVTNSFVAAGGDGYQAINKHHTFVDSGLVDAGVLKAFFENSDMVAIDDYKPENRFVRR